MPPDEQDEAGLPHEDSLFHAVREGGGGPEERCSDRAWKTERTILFFSLWGAGFFAVLGLVWGTLIGSQMLKFDGIYSFVSLVLSGLTIFFAKAAGEKGDEAFPLGRSQLEPLFLVLKALIYLVVCANAFVFALKSLMDGGREIHALSASLYAVVGIVGCLGGWLFIFYLRKRAGMSAFVMAEARQWLQDMLLSVLLLLGFLCGAYLQSRGHAELARFVDPLMTMAAALVFLVNPALMLVGGLRDMLLMAPKESVYRVSREALREIAQRHGFSGFLLRIRGSGRMLLYDVSYICENAGREFSMAELDGIREEATARLDAVLENPKWLRIGFAGPERTDLK